MQDSHPVKIKALANSPFNQIRGTNLAELNKNSNLAQAQLADWNQSLLESESEPEYIFQRKKKKKTKSKKQKKHASQLFKLCSYLKDVINSDSKVETFNSSHSFPWKKSAILTEIDSSDKNTAASNHRVKIAALQQSHHKNIIIYSDGSKLSEEKIGAGGYISYSDNQQQSHSWKLSSKTEVFDSELFAMLKSLQQAKLNVSSTVKDIWIFSDNQAVIKRIHKNSNSSGQEISYKLQQEAESLLFRNIQLHVCWVPGHMNIYGNEQADRAAKLAAEFNSSNVIDCSNEINISLTYLRKSVKKSLLQSWHNYYHNSEQKGTHYLNFQAQPA